MSDYDGNDAQELQSACYQAGKDNEVSMGKWFRTLYRLLLGQDRGPRVGTFVSVYGVDETLALIDERLEQDA